ncbi:MAG TPA: ATP-binding protein, partial [Bryobacteraceae bacterium]|nr:ATP-binding protein [Bryobacteraceae bacterium]
MEEYRMKRVAAPISLAGSQLGEARHVCAFFNSADEEYRVLLPFIKDRFECGDKAVHVVNPDQRHDHLQRIALSLSELQRNRVILRPELAGNLPLVTGDRVQLQQVIMNLLRNASDAMSDVEDRPRHLRIRTERDQSDHVCLTVQDVGVGFDRQAMSRLFDAFYTTKNDGMGIGLSVSRSIIESHHGRLWATLNDGPGATLSGEQALTEVHPEGEFEIGGMEPSGGLSLDTFAGKIQFKWAPEAGVSSLGQMPFFIEYLKTSGVFENWV